MLIQTLSNHISALLKYTNVLLTPLVILILCCIANNAF